MTYFQMYRVSILKVFLSNPSGPAKKSFNNICLARDCGRFLSHRHDYPMYSLYFLLFLIRIHVKLAAIAVIMMMLRSIVFGKISSLLNKALYHLLEYLHKILLDCES
jgi:hypothetical protein